MHISKWLLIHDASWTRHELAHAPPNLITDAMRPRSNLINALVMYMCRQFETLQKISDYIYN